MSHEKCCEAHDARLTHAYVAWSKHNGLYPPWLPACENDVAAPDLIKQCLRGTSHRLIFTWHTSVLSFSHTVKILDAEWEVR